MTMTAPAPAERTTTFNETLDTLYDSVSVNVTMPDGREITVGVMLSEGDNSTLVQIDTQEGTGNVRVFLNDGDCIFDADPETGEYRDMSEVIE